MFSSSWHCWLAFHDFQTIANTCGDFHQYTHFCQNPFMWEIRTRLTSSWLIIFLASEKLNNLHWPCWESQWYVCNRSNIPWSFGTFLLLGSLNLLDPLWRLVMVMQGVTETSQIIHIWPPLSWKIVEISGLLRSLSQFCIFYFICFHSLWFPKDYLETQHISCTSETIMKRGWIK